MESAFVRCVPHATLPFIAKDEAVFAKVVLAAFSQRRKTLRSTLAQWAGSREAVDALLETAGVDPSLRGEALDVAQFAAIAICQRIEIRQGNRSQPLNRLGREAQQQCGCNGPAPTYLPREMTEQADIVAPRCC